MGFLVVWAATFLVEPGGTPLELLAGGLVAVWGFMLFGHIFLRNRGHGEDFRYAQWRKEWGLTFLLTRVSGIPLLERKYRGNKEFEEYARRTRAFVPGPPKLKA